MESTTSVESSQVSSSASEAVSSQALAASQASSITTQAHHYIMQHFTQADEAAAQLTRGLVTSQANAMPFYLPVTFVKNDQGEHALTPEQHQALIIATQHQYMTPSPAHHNSFASGESPATPGSNSLGSPPSQFVDGSSSSRSATPANPGQTGSMDLQMQQKLQMQAALQAQQQLQMQQLAQQQQQDPAFLAQQAHLQAQAASKAELAKTLKPPKKPLTPYMRFSKSVWPSVKEANPNLSVCEIGANIGKMWRELSDEEKTRYNDDFTADKVRYDDEIQKYLKATGLQASDLVKPRSRKKKMSAAETKMQAPPQPKTPTSQPVSMHLFSGQQNNQTMLLQTQIGQSTQHVQQQQPTTQTTIVSQQNGEGGIPSFAQSWLESQQQQAQLAEAGQEPQQTQMSLNTYIAMLQAAAAAQQQQAQQAAVQAQQQAAAQAQQQAAAQAQQQAAAQAQQQAAAQAQQQAAAQAQQQAAAQAQQQAAAQAQQQAAAQAQQQAAAQAQQQAAAQAQHQAQQQAAAQRAAEQQQHEMSQQSTSEAQPMTSQASLQGLWHQLEKNAYAAHRSDAATSASQSPATTSHDQPTSQDKEMTANGPESSAHNLFNSYAYNPWSGYPAQGQFGGGESKPVDSKEGILSKELEHLRTALSEKVKEVERLKVELDKSYCVIEQLKQQNMALNSSLALITTQAHMTAHHIETEQQSAVSTPSTEASNG